MHRPGNEHAWEVLDALGSGLVVLDRARCVVAWNAWMAAASGIPERDVIGKRLDEVFPAPLPPRFASAISGALETGASRLLSHSLKPALLPLRTQSGQELIHNVSVRPLGQAPYARCLLLIVDVTLAAHRERILRER